MHSPIEKNNNAFVPPVPAEEAEARARALLKKMTGEEMFELVCGGGFCIRENERLGIPRIEMSDATQGIHIREKEPRGIEKSVAYPCALQLAATWNEELAGEYARCVGEECRAAGIGILLGPGVNIYRSSKCGRNFEYFGEDPCLASRLAAAYVRSLQQTGTIATIKHFICNNAEWIRRASNSIVEERALREIYLPAFAAGVRAGALAVMTAYNFLNGEYCGQNREILTGLLRGELGFEWLLMTDWTSVNSGEKLAASGMDLEMPSGEELEKCRDRCVGSENIRRMARSILKTCCAMGLYDRKAGDAPADLRACEATALQTAREGIVVLKNDSILPLPRNAGTILITGLRAETEQLTGRGSGRVAGYDNISYVTALTRKAGAEHVLHRRMPADAEIERADTVIVCPGFIREGEGTDRDFSLSRAQNGLIERCAAHNENVVVIITAGGGIAMDWNDRVRGIVHAFYGGQRGAEAVMEILFGEVNPSGKLPFTIERSFADSPAARDTGPDYEYYQERYTNRPIPAGAEDFDDNRPYPVRYDEGVFVGYRWYEKKGIDVRYCFGHGLSYTEFAYRDLRIDRREHGWEVSFTIRNTGAMDGAEAAQLYIQDDECSLERPAGELKGFQKVFLKKNEETVVTLPVTERDLSFYHPERNEWVCEAGTFTVHVGGSLHDIRLRGTIEAGA